MRSPRRPHTTWRHGRGAPEHDPKAGQAFDRPRLDCLQRITVRLKNIKLHCHDHLFNSGQQRGAPGRERRDHRRVADRCGKRPLRARAAAPSAAVASAARRSAIDPLSSAGSGTPASKATAWPMRRPTDSSQPWPPAAGRTRNSSGPPELPFPRGEDRLRGPAEGRVRIGWEQQQADHQRDATPDERVDDPVGGRGAGYSSRTLCSAVSMTLSILPVRTCLARLRVKPSAVLTGTWEGSASA